MNNLIPLGMDMDLNNFKEESNDVNTIKNASDIGLLPMMNMSVENPSMGMMIKEGFQTVKKYDLAFVLFVIVIVLFILCMFDK